MHLPSPTLAALGVITLACRPPTVSPEDTGYRWSKRDSSPPGQDDFVPEDSDARDTDMGDTGDSWTPSPERAAWTLMIFIAGDNNLEEAALGDMNELERVGSTERVNVLVQLDRSRYYSSADGDWTGSRRYRVERDDSGTSIGSPILEDLGETDSGSPDTVADFATWAIQGYPAERYGLVMWNHGWGWSLSATAGTKGVSSDDATGNDISVAEGELEALLAAASEEIGAPLDLLGMDACLMGSWEVGHTAAPYADVYVASQASEGLDGWAYDTSLADLVADPDMDAASLGETIALRFHETYDSTMSVVDLETDDELVETLDALALAMMETGQAEQLLRDGAHGAQDFEHGWGVDHDLGDVLDRLESSSSADTAVLAAVEATREVYERTVLANYVWGNDVRGATGLSIYTPTWGSVDPDYFDGRWSEDTLWDDFLDAARSGN